MSVQLFELFHGAVLTKLMRSEVPTSLRMVERNVEDGWAAYRLNDEVGLYIKYRTKPRSGGRARSTIWSFNFSSSELERIRELQKQTSMYVALVCGRRKLDPSKRDMEICLLNPDDVPKCIELTSNETDTINVVVQARKSLRAYGRLNSEAGDQLIVPRNRIDEWHVPGS